MQFLNLFQSVRTLRTKSVAKAVAGLAKAVADLDAVAEAEVSAANVKFSTASTLLAESKAHSAEADRAAAIAAKIRNLLGE